MSEWRTAFHGQPPQQARSPGDCCTESCVERRLRQIALSNRSHTPLAQPRSRSSHTWHSPDAERERFASTNTIGRHQHHRPSIDTAVRLVSKRGVFGRSRAGCKAGHKALDYWFWLRLRHVRAEATTGAESRPRTELLDFCTSVKLTDRSEDGWKILALGDLFEGIPPKRPMS